MIFDSHSHAWRRWPYEPRVPDPRTRGAVEQLLYEMDRNGVDRAVVVSARLPGNTGNNEYVATQVARHPERLVHFADLDSYWSPTYHTAGAARRLIALHDRLGVRGIAHYLAERPDEWLTSEEGLALFHAAGSRGLIVSVACRPVWYAEIERVAASFPQLPILLHHLGGVSADEIVDPQALEGLARLARLPNVFVKVSGFHYASRRKWEYPYHGVLGHVRRLRDWFGARRLCWGSDYPVVTRAMTYRQAIEVVRTHCSFFDAEELTAVLGATLDHLLQGRWRPSLDAAGGGS